MGDAGDDCESAMALLTDGHGRPRSLFPIIHRPELEPTNSRPGHATRLRAPNRLLRDNRKALGEQLAIANPIFEGPRPQNQFPRITKYVAREIGLADRHGIVSIQAKVHRSRHRSPMLVTFPKRCRAWPPARVFVFSRYPGLSGPGKSRVPPGRTTEKSVSCCHSLVSSEANVFTGGRGPVAAVQERRRSAGPAGAGRFGDAATLA